MITISQIIQEYGIEHLGRFYGTYRGIVISNTDDDNTETLKVTIPAIYDGLTTIARPKGQEGGPNTGFKYLTPKPGQIVLVEFEYGDPLRALWTYHGWATEERPEELDKDTLGIVTPNGNKVYLKEQDNTLYIITKESVNIQTKSINLVDGKVGIPETTPLVERLNKVESALNQLLNAIRNSTPITDNSGAGLKSSIVAKMGPNITPTKADDISSKYIKQPQ